MTQGQVQLGKNGITENFIATLKSHFKNHGDIKVVVLRGASREKAQIKEYSKKILGSLGSYYTAKIIGFTIFIKKWRKPRR